MKCFCCDKEIKKPKIKIEIENKKIVACDDYCAYRIFDDFEATLEKLKMY